MTDGDRYWTGIVRKPGTSATNTLGRREFQWLDTATGELFALQANRESWVINTGGSPNGFWSDSGCPVCDFRKFCAIF